MADPDVHLDPRDAERLLNLDELPGRRHGDVAMLLAAAAAPARPHELAGEHEAVAGYHRVFRPRMRGRRRLVLAALATTLTLSLGGTAYAARTGQLPAPLQQTAHALLSGVGVPGPAAPTGEHSATRSTIPAPPDPDPSPSPAPMADLCRAWEAFRNSPQATPVTGVDRRSLARAAGGDPTISAYCRQLLGTAPTPSGSGSTSDSPTPKPGNPSPGVKKPSHAPRGRPS